MARSGKGPDVKDWVVSAWPLQVPGRSEELMPPRGSGCPRAPARRFQSRIGGCRRPSASSIRRDTSVVLASSRSSPRRLSTFELGPSRIGVITRFAGENVSPGLPRIAA